MAVGVGKRVRENFLLYHMNESRLLPKGWRRGKIQEVCSGLL